MSALSSNHAASTTPVNNAVNALVIAALLTVAGLLDAVAAASVSSGAISIHNDIRPPTTHSSSSSSSSTAAAAKEWDVDNSADDIRCFCNMPKCITAGYMCRTARNRHGGCYWEQRSGRDQSSRDTRHGCLELLKDEFTAPKCNQTLRPLKTSGISGVSAPAPLLLCCQEDMCNHFDRPDHQRDDDAAAAAAAEVLQPRQHQLQQQQQQRQHIAFVNRSGVEQIDHKTTTIYASGAGLGGDGTLFEKQLMIEHAHTIGVSGDHHNGAAVDASTATTTTASSSSRDGWFRAATIVFPIGGAVIVFALIALAVRILNHDGDANSAVLDGGPYGSKQRRHGGGGAKLDCDAYTINHHHHHHGQPGQPHLHPHLMQHQHQMCAHGPLLHNNYRKPSGLSTPALITNDLKNVAPSKKNHAKTFEYSLLPQRCYESAPGKQKATNAAAQACDAAAASNNVNLSRTSAAAASSAASAAVSTSAMSSAYSDPKDYKVYEKASLSASPYWTTTTMPCAPNNTGRMG